MRTLNDTQTGEELLAVYVPTTPNPTSGYLEIVPLNNVMPTDWSVDEATTFVVSGGAVAPDDIRLQKGAQSAESWTQGSTGHAHPESKE